MSHRYRAIVIGCGAIGAATAYWLSRRLGGDVLVLEQYDLGHTQGASEDHSRIIRHAYSRPEYTALTPAAYQSWNLIEQSTGLSLVQRTGGLILAESGTSGATYLTQTAAAMSAAGLPFDEFSGTDVTRRWPQWRLGPQHQALFDPEAGVLDIRRATAAHVALARDNGATVIPRAQVQAIAANDAGVRVEAGDVVYTADTLALCGGAWNPVLLRMLGADLRITLTEEQVTYFATTKLRDFAPERFPIYGFIDTDDLLYYGFPIYGEVATKAGIDGAGPVVTTESRTHAADPQRIQHVRRFLERYLPDALGPELYSRVCCYDFPPDRDFIADHVPGHDRVVVCAGAGHAGKFAGLLGRILTELLLDGASRFPIQAFSADRPAIAGGAPAGPVRSNSI
ncbi:N-methyl-L-tryptophan oxidase [Nonomuraea bangladeshensis]|uniref:N-methyl-L-tryptophan oxidase n=1 Tax=Nonomuraea bangladeshensis TaxID=404385 RepID=UPI0031E2AF25